MSAPWYDGGYPGPCVATVPCQDGDDAQHRFSASAPPSDADATWLQDDDDDELDAQSRWFDDAPHEEPKANSSACSSGSWIAGALAEVMQSAASASAEPPPSRLEERIPDTVAEVTQATARLSQAELTQFGAAATLAEVTQLTMPISQVSRVSDTLAEFTQVSAAATLADVTQTVVFAQTLAPPTLPEVTQMTAPLSQAASEQGAAKTLEQYTQGMHAATMAEMATIPEMTPATATSQVLDPAAIKELAPVKTQLSQATAARQLPDTLPQVQRVVDVKAPPVDENLPLDEVQVTGMALAGGVIAETIDIEHRTRLDDSPPPQRINDAGVVDLECSPVGVAAGSDAGVAAEVAHVRPPSAVPLAYRLRLPGVQEHLDLISDGSSNEEEAERPEPCVEVEEVRVADQQLGGFVEVEEIGVFDRPTVAHETLTTLPSSGWLDTRCLAGAAARRSAVAAASRPKKAARTGPLPQLARGHAATSRHAAQNAVGVGHAVNASPIEEVSRSLPQPPASVPPACAPSAAAAAPIERKTKTSLKNNTRFQELRARIVGKNAAPGPTNPVPAAQTDDAASERPVAAPLRGVDAVAPPPKYRNEIWFRAR